jgi:hypothetical protein
MILMTRNTKRTSHSLVRSIGAVLTLGATLAMPSWADSFFFSAGAPDGQAGAVSRPASPGKIETETADDFTLPQTTVIKSAIIRGFLAGRTPLANVTNVEVEFYNEFPLNSAPFDGRVPTRNNSPADVEIGSATRDSSTGGLSFIASQASASFTIINSVVTDISLPNFNTGGDHAMGGQLVEIAITFTNPVILPAGHYFFRPEVDVNGDNFLFVSAPRPIVAPGTPVAIDRQAWIRNTNTKPDWLRVGTDIIGGAVPPTYNMSFSITGESLPDAGTPGQANCHGKTTSAAANLGGLPSASAILGYPTVDALRDAIIGYCEP